jgi:quinol monooxygenase YgiN
MITRIVKLSIAEEFQAEFRDIFAKNNKHIEAFPGCKQVKLVEDIHQKGIFFTLSTWENQESIDAYRASELFGGIWPRVKTMFNGKPEAWSTFTIENQ